MRQKCVSEGLSAFDEDIEGSRQFIDSFTKRRNDEGGRCAFDILEFSNRQNEWSALFVSM
jgi:hypothetical protein